MKGEFMGEKNEAEVTVSGKHLVFSELSFDEGPHVYKLNGVEVPSVSQIMRPLSDHHYGTISPETLRVAAERGTEVHSAIEVHTKYGIDDIDDTLVSYFDAYLRWEHDFVPAPVGSEIRAYHPIMRYAGTIDMLAIIDGDLTLIDFKTTSTVVESSCGVQLEAYAQMLAAHGVEIQRKAIVQLKPTGQYKFVPFPANDPQRWRVFGALKTVYDYLYSQG